MNNAPITRADSAAPRASYRLRAVWRRDGAQAEAHGFFPTFGAACAAALALRAAGVPVVIASGSDAWRAAP